MRSFVVMGHSAFAYGDFSLNDLPGSAGRMDIMTRCVTSSLFISHGLRKDAQVHLILEGELLSGELPRVVTFAGADMKHLNPDERSTAALIRNALIQYSKGKRASPGISVRTSTLDGVLASLNDHEIFLLAEDGKDIRESSLDETKDLAFVLSDNVDFSKDEMTTIMKHAKMKLSLGPLPILSSQCITIVNNELDRRRTRVE